MQGKSIKVPKKLAEAEGGTMYRRDNQLRIEDFVFPYGKLKAKNEWVKLSAMVPWDAVEERYAL